MITELTLLHCFIEVFLSLVVLQLIMLFAMEFLLDKILKDGDIVNVDVTAYQEWMAW